MRFLLVVPTLTLAACGSAAEVQVPPATPAVAVTTEPVRVLPVSRPLRGAGRVRAADEARLSFPFGGVVAEVRVARGEEVRAGQVLALLDGSAAAAQLAGARSALVKAERDAARAQALEGTALSAAQRQDAMTGLEIARANVDAASFQARRSVLVAPAQGRIVEALAETGETVGPGQPVLTFAGGGGFEVELVLSAADALIADPGTLAEARVGALDLEVPGRVVERAGGAGPLGGFTVVVALDPAPGLASGLAASVDLTPAPRPFPTVPVEALAEADGPNAAVYVVQDGVARRTPVTVAFLADPLVALREAPPEGTLVVVRGVPFVRDGAPVEPR